jgi:hypothetical protein
MPRMDGTGPLGKGPMTGGQRGVCQRQGAQPADQPESVDYRVMSRGLGNRRQGRIGKDPGGGSRDGQGHRGNGNR